MTANPKSVEGLVAPTLAVPVARTKSSTSTATHATNTTAIANTTSSSQLGYPHGHLGHLNEFEEDSLRRFRDLLEERGLYKRGPPASHDDATLLRFLRARRWVPEDAYTQLKATEDWRAANDIDVLYNTIELDAYEQSRKMYPQWTGRRDRRGIPLYVFEIKQLTSKSISKYEKLGANKSFSKAKTDGKTPPGLMRLFALYENLTRFNQPFCSQLTDREHPDVPITMSTNIVDIEGVGLKQFWDLKSHMQAASQLATAHYPETLDRIFIIGAPPFFSTVWGWIKRWFDPITVSKIFILGPKEVQSTLESFIEPRNIPTKYHGELDYQFGQLGVPDPGWEGVVAWENGHSSFPSGPLLWEEIEGDRLLCVGLGSENGEPRKERICTVPKTYPHKASEVNGLEKTITSDSVHIAPETQNDATQTDDAVTSGAAVEKLALNGDEKRETTELPPAVPTTVV